MQAQIQMQELRVRILRSLIKDVRLAAIKQDTNLAAVVSSALEAWLHKQNGKPTK